MPPTPAEPKSLAVMQCPPMYLGNGHHVAFQRPAVGLLRHERLPSRGVCVATRTGSETSIENLGKLLSTEATPNRTRCVGTLGAWRQRVQAVGGL